MQLRLILSRDERKKYPGIAKWSNMVIGGQTPDGQDATNELTYLVLEAVKRCPTPHHSILLRVHAGTPDSLMLKGIELLKTGIGLPALIGDNSAIGFLLSNGVPLRVARDYAVTVTHEVSPIGRSRMVVYRTLVVPLVLDFFLHNGIEPRTGKQLGPRTGDLESFKTFDRLMRGFKEQFAYFMGLTAEHNNITAATQRELLPDPAASALTVNGVKEGKDIFDRTMPFENGTGMNVVGMINVADSLAAIKKLVFDEKKVTMNKLKTALAANWQGYEDIRQMCLAAPKYGNDEDYVDSIAKELYEFYIETAVTFDSVFGGKFKPAAVSLTAQRPGGELTGATPDGRYAGEWLADDSLSAMRGRDTHGARALIKSALKIDQVPFMAISLSMKFHPSALETTDDMRKLSDLIKTYFLHGGKNIQLNVVSNDTLLDAQRHPENYRDLIVRIGDYNTYFVQLDKEVQDKMIERTEHQRVV